jgi:hypothetical protein
LTGTGSSKPSLPPWRLHSRTSSHQSAGTGQGRRSGQREVVAEPDGRCREPRSLPGETHYDAVRGFGWFAGRQEDGHTCRFLADLARSWRSVELPVSGLAVRCGTYSAFDWRWLPAAPSWLTEYCSWLSPCEVHAGSCRVRCYTARPAPLQTSHASRTLCAWRDVVLLPRTARYAGTLSREQGSAAICIADLMQQDAKLPGPARPALQEAGLERRAPLPHSAGQRCTARPSGSQMRHRSARNGHLDHLALLPAASGTGAGSGRPRYSVPTC